MKSFRRRTVERYPRNISVCIDGTWNYAEQMDDVMGAACPTNVAKIRDGMVEDESRQVVGYFRGLGNEKEHWIVGQLLGGGLGAGAYPLLFRVHCWLTENWRPGDRLSIFGFSRGAALARMLANSVRERGIAEKIVMKRKSVGGRKSGHYSLKPYRYGLVKDVPVSFLGCWDTVAAFGISADFLGIPFQEINLFKDFTVSGNVEQAVHCVALDERRHEFLYTPMNPGKNVTEVWFAGWHGDVGGGNVDCEDGLGDITLDFMVKEAKQAGVLFKHSWEKELSVQPDYIAPLHPQKKIVRNEPRVAPADVCVDVSVRMRMLKDPSYFPAALESVEHVVWVNG